MIRTDFSALVFPLTRKEQRYCLNPEESQHIYHLLPSRVENGERIYTFLWAGDASVRDRYATLTEGNSNSLRHPNVLFSRQPRFSQVPSHHHNYLEMNYVYAGSCKTVINGKALELHAGDLCLLERDVIHSISPLGKEDILLNGMIKHSYFDMYLMNRLAQSGPVARFLADVISHKTVHNKHMIFHTENTPMIREIMESLCCEYLEPGLCSVETVDSYMTLLFIQLARCYESRKENSYRESDRSYMTEVLRYVEDHCESCTLQETATHFGFHPNYLSRIIRHATGLSFTDHVSQARLHRAEYLLRYSDESTAEIAAKCGWSNINQFYKKFKESYGANPGEYRRNTNKL